MDPISNIARSLQPPEFSEATLIVFASPATINSSATESSGTDTRVTDSQIWESVRALGRVHCRTQVLVVDPEAKADYTASIPLSYRPIPPVFRDLTSALSAAKHPTIMILDPDAKLNAGDWQWAYGRKQPANIQSYTHQTKPTKRLTQFLVAAFQILLRVLLKTRKSSFTPGLVVLPRPIVRSVLPMISSVRRKPIPGLETTAVLAFAKLQGETIEEVVLEDAHEGSSIGSKSVLRSMHRVLQFWWNQIMFPLPLTEDQTFQKKTNRTRQLVSTLVLLVAASGILFTNLGFPLFEPDEARNAQLAINVIESGDWLSLTLAGEPYWDKPPLQIWSIAACYQLFGVSPVSTRLPSAMAAVLTVLFTLVFGRKLVGFKSAFIGAAMLLLSAGFLLIGRYVTMDASLTCWTTLTLFSSYLAVSRSNKNWLMLAGIGAGIGVLVKGPVILVLAAPPLLATLILQGQAPQFKLRQWLWFLVPAFLIAAPWFIATSIVHPDFLVYFFWKHHVVRFSDAFNHREPFWYYLPVIFLMMFPASYLLPSLVKFLTSRNAANRSLRTKHLGFLLLTAVWIIGFFSISESKLPTYILPALPAICLLMGVMLNKKIFSTAASGWEITGVNSGALSYLESTPPRSLLQFSILTLAITVTVPLVLQVDWWVVGLLAVCLLVVLSTTWMVRYRQPSRKFAWYGWTVMAATVLLLCTHLLMPSFSRHRSIHTAASYLRDDVEMSDAPVVFFGRENYGASMTLPKKMVHYFDSADAPEICEFLSANPKSVIVAGKDDMENLRKWLSWKILLEKSDVGRHVYVSRPNQSVVAEQPRNSVFR